MDDTDSYGLGGGRKVITRLVDRIERKKAILVTDGILIHFNMDSMTLVFF